MFNTFVQHICPPLDRYMYWCWYSSLKRRPLILFVLQAAFIMNWGWTRQKSENFCRMKLLPWPLSWPVKEMYKRSKRLQKVHSSLSSCRSRSSSTSLHPLFLLFLLFSFHLLLFLFVLHPSNFDSFFSWSSPSSSLNSQNFSVSFEKAVLPINWWEGKDHVIIILKTDGFVTNEMFLVKKHFFGEKNAKVI